MYKCNKLITDKTKLVFCESTVMIEKGRSFRLGHARRTMEDLLWVNTSKSRKNGRTDFLIWLTLKITLSFGCTIKEVCDVKT